MNTAILEKRPLVLLFILKSSFATFPTMPPISSRIILLYINPGSPGSQIQVITMLKYGCNGEKYLVHCWTVRYWP
ncbi:hypothetical protein ES332_A09G063500v1 [Gossypium tomentosum]|uniref:Uncharacterized protein n=1 Tax=Gossypium tomentosum TaxID=34277 RepID=A0A5D2P1W7_GOSTO|nr:hypothetical protein ES332_A09G063500v1 [Gossypium tomentosum]